VQTHRQAQRLGFSQVTWYQEIEVKMREWKIGKFLESTRRESNRYQKAKPILRTKYASGQFNGKRTISFLAFAFLLHVVLPGAICQARAEAEKASYPAMAPLELS
jgi:hypothetical protein